MAAINRQYTERAGAVDIEVVNQTAERKKPDTVGMRSEELLHYQESHFTDEQCYKAVMATPVYVVDNELECIYCKATGRHE